MLEIAEEAAMRVMAEAQEMGGAVSGEHGIGITKIAFLGKDKMDAIREFKNRWIRATYSTPPSSRSVNFPCVRSPSPSTA